MLRLLVVAAGLLLAFLAGCCFLATALLVEGFAAPAAASRVVFDVAALLLSGLRDGSVGRLLHAGLGAVWTALLVTCLAPVSAIALLSELVGLRSLVWWSGATGIATAAVPTVLAAVRNGPVDPDAAGGHALPILFLTGVLTGFVDWMVAGRSAGPRRDSVTLKRTGPCVSEESR